MKIFYCLAFALVAACTSHVGTATSNQLSCSATADCTAVGGGACVSGTCRATNECSSTHPCPTATEICVPDAVFGGLCAEPGTTPTPLPSPSCRTSADCPPNEACTSTGLCVATTPQCVTNADCPTGENCNAVCTAGGLTVHECQPAGVPIEVCPDPCLTDADCPTGERCNPVCATTGVIGHVCQPDGVPTQVCN